ncbi:F-box protein GID2-like [Phoenix dactylifera]|uniref:F-box protein GID2 n=1 Tax=Phoenix dactylifera TaxID=42345 RepID=A0A8B7CTK0_PHODC|nr:F-box protein GID2-like [Phoenix dactylifera]
MKRRSIDGSEGGDSRVVVEEANKKQKGEKDAEAASAAEEVVVAELGEDLVFEVLKRADARTLAAAACVCRRWRRLAEDERLWEAVCVRHWANIGCGNQQLRSVVLALGGFRRLHSLYLLPLLHPSLRRPAPLPTLPLPATSATMPPRRPHLPARWGKDEVQLSLSLLSIGYFERMNPNYKRGGGGS